MAFTADLFKFQFLPGFFTEETQTAEPGRWVDGNLVRFKNGLPQSLGGWRSRPLSSSMLGIPRSTHDWVALDQTKYIAVGTEKRLYLIEEDLTLTNITPIRDSGQLTDPFHTSTAGAFDPNSTGDASYFKVNDAGHGVSVGDLVTFDGFTDVGGLTIDGDYEVISVTDADNYVLKADTDATSTIAGGGGTGNYTYEITVGQASTGVLAGFGTGAYGEGTWGTPREGSTFVKQLRTWSLDNWGEDLIASPRGGAIYVWDKTLGTTTRATEIANAPSTNLRVLVSQQNRQLISLGAHNGASSDPLFIAWSHTEDYTTWIPDSTNNAGDRRIDQGSEIITAVSTRSGIVIFTDEGAHIMQPVSSNDIFGFRSLGGSISIAGPAAATEAAGVVYVMGKSNFFVFDGTLRVLPCSVWGHVFENLNVDQSFSVHCSHSKDFNEIWWFYPSAQAASNDRYVVYNYVEGIWFFGSLGRASYGDFSSFFSKPYAFDNQGTLYTHEDGDDADNQPMASYIESSYRGGGNESLQINKMIPDFKRLNGSVSLTLKGKKRPQSTPISKGPYTGITSATEEVGARIRARYVAIRVDQQGLGENFRMGTWQAEGGPDGER